MFHNPGGDWHPSWGVNLKYSRHVWKSRVSRLQIALYPKDREI